MSDRLSEKFDEDLRATFFRSITLVTSASGIILAGSEGILFPAALTPVFAILGWILVDSRHWLRLPPILGNLLGLLALGIAVSEFTGGTLERKLLSGAHLIVYLTWIVLIFPKSNRQYWWLIALSLLQIAIAGVLSAGVSFGATMVGMMGLLLWTLSVFSLFRVQDQHARRIASFKATLIPQFAGMNGSRTSSNTAFDIAMDASPRSMVRRIVGHLRPFLGLSSTAGSGKPRGQNGHTSGQILVRNGLQRDPSEVWVGWRFRWMVVSSGLISLVLAAFVFAAFPRVWVPGSTLLGEGTESARNFQNRTGFTGTVQLGSIGQLLENNARVLTFEISDLKNQKEVTAEAFASAMNMDEIRFRGSVVAHYSNGQWSKGFAEKGYSSGEEVRRIGESVKLPTDFRVTIVQDPPLGLFAFAPFPVSRVKTSGPARLVQSEVSATLLWDGREESESESISRAFEIECPRLEQHPSATFETWSSQENLPESVKKKDRDRRAEFAASVFIMDGFDGQNYESVNGFWERRKRLYNEQYDLKLRLPRLYGLANDLCRENGTLCRVPDRIQRISDYLSNSGGFSYSLRQTRQDRSLDPIEDFLINTKSGHCEYFASACTLMLQSVRVPARLVTGYYGSEVNSLTGKNEVRQRHSHAWVEAFVDDQWRTVEPTPSAERRDTVVSTGSVSLISNLQLAISDLWNDGVHRMSAERQQQFFSPVIDTLKSAFQSIRERGLLTVVQQWVTGFLRSPEQWFSWQGGLLSFVVLLLLVVLARLHIMGRLFNWLRSVRDRLSGSQRTARSVIRFYEGFCLLCERNGLTIPPSNSALENAGLAIVKFESVLPSPELRSVPVRIANAFNAVRFGSLTLTEEQAAGIGHDLNAFAGALESRRRMV